MIVHHVGTPTPEGITWVSVAVYDDGSQHVLRQEQEGFSPLRPPIVREDALQRIDVPDLAVQPDGFERTIAYWLGPGVSARDCRKAKVQGVHGGVPICWSGQSEVAGDVHPAGDAPASAILGAGLTFAVAVAALVVGGRWLSLRAKVEAREAWLKRELSG